MSICSRFARTPAINGDYRDLPGVIRVNLGAEADHLGHGERIAQAVVAAVPLARFVEVARVAPTARGSGGFGSGGAGR